MCPYTHVRYKANVKFDVLYVELRGCMKTYFASLSIGKAILWCYLIWYLVTLCFYFDPAPGIWLNALGISVIIGIGLNLSVSGGGKPREFWQVFRLFLMPFCVSSFSSLIKGKGFFLIFPPSPGELFVSVGLCVVFVVTISNLRVR